ncbi:MAG: glycosyl hydrolase [Nanoarchaeota archaeon]
MKKFLIAILIFILVIFAVNLLRTKNQDEWSLKKSDEMFSGPAQKRVPIKDASLAVPADSKANQDAAILLRYFYSQSNNSKENLILSGQNIGSASDVPQPLSSSYPKYFTSLKEQTGKLPAIMGIDYGWEQIPDDYAKVNTILIDFWKKGGLIEISMSPSNPFTGKGIRNFGLGEHAFDDLFVEGNEAHKRWIADLDKVAAGLKQLQDAGVVVLWRPLHEMNGDWFWWSYGEKGRISKEEYAKLWKHIFDYFTKEKELHNLLWVYSPNAQLGNNLIKSSAFYYPGHDYADIVGLDYYWDDLTKVNDNSTYDELVALGKPLGFSEIGPQSRTGFDNMMIIKAINNKYPQMIFAIHWQGWSRYSFFHTSRAIGENQNAKEYMNDPLIVTLDEMGLSYKHG